jgi:hypothetical protein
MPDALTRFLQSQRLELCTLHYPCPVPKALLEIDFQGRQRDKCTNDIRSLVASKDFNEGDTVLSSLPIAVYIHPDSVSHNDDVSSLNSSHSLRPCQFCLLAYRSSSENTSKNRMLRCSRCKVVYYCSPSCQKSDWLVGGHKGRCNTLRDMLDGLNSMEHLAIMTDNIVQVHDLTGTQVLDGKFKQRQVEMVEDLQLEWDAIRYAAMDLETLESHLMKTDTTNFKTILQSCERIAKMRYANTKNNVHNNTPNRSDEEECCSRLLNHSLRIRANGFTVTSSKRDVAPFASAHYPLGSLMNHSCCPNVNVVYEGRRQVVRASKFIPKGTEIVSCYIDPILSHDERQSALFSQYGFQCTCPRCTPGTQEFSLDSWLHTIPPKTPTVTSIEIETWILSLWENPHEACNESYRLIRKEVLRQHAESSSFPTHTFIPSKLPTPTISRQSHPDTAPHIQGILHLYPYLSSLTHYLSDSIVQSPSKWRDTVVLAETVVAIRQLVYPSSHNLINDAWITLGYALFNAAAERPHTRAGEKCKSASGLGWKECLEEGIRGYKMGGGWDEVRKEIEEGFNIMLESE